MVSEGVEESGGTEVPQSKFRYNSPFVQVSLIGLVCFCCPGVFNALSGTGGGGQAAALKIAEQYVDASGNIAKQGTTVLLPSASNNPAGMISQALSIYKSLVNNPSTLRSTGGTHSDDASSEGCDHGVRMIEEKKNQDNA